MVVGARSRAGRSALSLPAKGACGVRARVPVAVEAPVVTGDGSAGGPQAAVARVVGGAPVAMSPELRSRQLLHDQ
jgi:hypothetical protein